MARAEGTRDALELRASGLGYSEIAERLGTARSTVYDRIQAALAALPSEAASVVMALELARLDRSHARLEPEAERGDPRAIEVQIKIGARRSALLGLDEAIRVETSTPALPDDIAALKERLAKLLEGVNATQEG